MKKRIKAILYLFIVDKCYKRAEYHIKQRNKHHLKAKAWLEKGKVLFEKYETLCKAE